jgi:probable rRNA maturation factor
VSHAIEVQGDDDALVQAVEADAAVVLAALLDEPAELSIVLMDDDGIQALNRDWRGKDAPTDVLSFPQQEAPVTGGVLGDAVISIATAERQAADVGHDLRTELRVLLVHGVCHLLGHDHHTDAESDAMLAEEARLLTLFGLETGLVGRARDAAER